MTFAAILLNVLVPILVAGVVTYLISMPNAPLSPRAKQLATWVIWAAVILWMLFWALGALGVVGSARGPVLRER